ncbi:eag [Symbiodinium sp. CCMP2592]|nr:eag [Symbiodinium sp. CCMP2592]
MQTPLPLAETAAGGRQELTDFYHYAAYHTTTAYFGKASVMAPLDDDEEDAPSDASAQADDEGSESGALPSYLQHERAMLQRGLLATHQTGWSSAFDLEALCDRLHGLSVEEAEKDAREALQEAKDEARDGDVLAILLQVFQSARSSVLDSDEAPTDYTWTEVLGYCSRLCALCDRNFLSLAGQPGPDDFPLRVVASVYAECGRTLSVAGRPTEARNRLQKALNVFGLISEPTEEEAWLLAGCRASLARAFRQLGQFKGTQDEFLQALQLMADLPESYEVAELLSEYCEALGEAPKGDRLVSSALVDLMATMMEEKFGEGSEEHIQALQELSAACVAAEKPALAAPLFVTLSRLLREYYGDEPDTWEMQELQAVEEKAAQCLEGGAAVHMSEGDLEAAVALWSLALRMREGLHAEEEVLTEMRQSLDALKQAAAAAAASEAEGPASTLAPEDAQQTEASDPLETSKEEEEDARPDSWDETDEPSASSSIKEGASSIQAFVDGWPKYLAARLGAATYDNANMDHVKEPIFVDGPFTVRYPISLGLEKSPFAVCCWLASKAPRVRGIPKGSTPMPHEEVKDLLAKLQGSSPNSPHFCTKETFHFYKGPNQEIYLDFVGIQLVNMDFDGGEVELH